MDKIDTSRPAKEVHTQKLMEYLSDPSNPPVNRGEYYKIIGLAHGPNLYKSFTTNELRLLEDAALAERRTRYSTKLMAVDSAMLDKAANGDSSSAALVYKRLEGWSERKSVDIVGEFSFVSLAQVVTNAIGTEGNMDAIEASYEDLGEFQD